VKSSGHLVTWSYVRFRNGHCFCFFWHSSIEHGDNLRYCNCGFEHVFDRRSVQKRSLKMACVCFCTWGWISSLSCGVGYTSRRCYCVFCNSTAAQDCSVVANLEMNIFPVFSWLEVACFFCQASLPSRGCSLCYVIGWGLSPSVIRFQLTAIGSIIFVSFSPGISC
jgi:hypothetical protein